MTQEHFDFLYRYDEKLQYLHGDTNRFSSKELRLLLPIYESITGTKVPESHTNCFHCLEERIKIVAHYYMNGRGGFVNEDGTPKTSAITEADVAENKEERKRIRRKYKKE